MGCRLESYSSVLGAVGTELYFLKAQNRMVEIWATSVVPAVEGVVSEVGEATLHHRLLFSLTFASAHVWCRKRRLLDKDSEIRQDIAQALDRGHIYASVT